MRRSRQWIDLHWLRCPLTNTIHHSSCLQAHRSTVVVPPSPLLDKLRKAGVASEYDVILLQELPGQWADPMTPDKVKKLLHPVSPSY